MCEFQPTPPERLRSFIRSIPILASLYLALLLPLIGLPSIGGSAEAREAHVAKVVFEQNEWILPLRNGVIPSKPPLYHWLTVLLAKVTGDVNEFTARLTSAIAAALLLVIGMLLAREYAKCFKVQSNTLTEVTFGLILALTHGFSIMAMTCQVDMVFSLFATGAVVALLLPIFRESALLEKHFVWFYTLSSFAVLAKGPLGLVLPLWCSFCCVAFLKGIRSALKIFLRPRLGWLVFLVIAVPWYLLASIRGESDFIGRQIIFENLLRFFGGENINSEAWWFYIPSFLRTTFPWGLLAMYFVVKEWRTAGPANRIAYLPLIWFLAGLLLFSLSSGKRHSYLLPLYPALALYLSVPVSVWVREKVRVSNRRVYGYGVSMVAALLVLEGTGLYVKNGLKRFREAAHDISQRVPPDLQIVLLKDPPDELFDPLLFYLGREVEMRRPTIENITCADRTHVFLSRAPFFELLKSDLSRTPGLHEQARYRQSSDEMRDRKDREIVLFDCLELST